MQLIKVVPMLVLVSLFFAPDASALKRIKLDPNSANGRCLPEVKGRATEVLTRNRVGARMTDGKAVPEPVRAALAEVIHTIEKIGARKFDYHHDVTFIFGYRNGFSSHASGTREINLNPGGENSFSLVDKRFGGIMNRGVLAHELAHYISMRDNFNIQLRYQREVPQPCYLTNYAHTTASTGWQTLRTEEFAEVFAAYITQPNLLTGKGGGCKRAREYLAELFEEKRTHSESCETRKASLGAPAKKPAEVPLPKPRPNGGPAPAASSAPAASITPAAPAAPNARRPSSDEEAAASEEKALPPITIVE